MDAFGNELVNELEKVLGDGFSVHLEKVRKNNDVLLDAIAVRQEKSALTTLLYPRESYKEYARGASITDLAEQMAEQYRKAAAEAEIPEDFLEEYDKVKSRIFCKLVNYKMNKELLKHVPHKRIWEDLCLIGYYEMEPGCLGNATVRIDRRLVEKWGITEAEFLDHAMENTMRERGPVFRSLRSVLREYDLGVPESEDEEEELYMLTTKDRNLGTVCILYPGIREQIAEMLHADLLLLPSSIHEWLILADKGGYSEEDINQMIREINHSQVIPEEILSDHVYRYHRSCVNAV
ncbi:MAG: DUF5688 family protein [Eubacteriales bacterium]|nr:DUF5688 family protein [Eubacteriales bacterium]